IIGVLSKPFVDWRCGRWKGLVPKSSNWAPRQPFASMWANDSAAPPRDADSDSVVHTRADSDSPQFACGAFDHRGRRQRKHAPCKKKFVPTGIAEKQFG